jgi:hypothetical protein
VRPHASRPVAPQFSAVVRPLMARVEWFEDLLVEDLSGVTFVRNYVQLQFNPNPMLNVYTPITVTAEGRQNRTGEQDFANALIGQINKHVAKVTIEPETSISIHFRDGSVVSFSTRSEDVEYEAFTLFTKGGGVYEE